MSDDYQIVKYDFETLWGKKVSMLGRKGTNDRLVMSAVMVFDEYKSKSFDYKDNDIFIDLGSHINTWSILMGTINPTFKVYAYEALLDNYILMKDNVRLNNLNNVYSFKNAVSDTSEGQEKIFYRDGDTDFDRGHRFIGSIGGGSKKYSLVDKISMDDIIESNSIENCKVLKTDIEGAEVKAFGSIKEENLLKIENIVGEFHSYGGVDFDGFFEYFKPHFIDLSEEHGFDTSNKYFRDFLFRRKDSV